MTTAPGASVGCQRRGELGFNGEVEGLAVHRARDHPRSRQTIVSQACDEGLGAPFAERGAGLEAFAAPCPPARPRHLGVD